MKITKYKRKKLNRYEITFDEIKTIELFDDTILKYNLLIEKCIDKKKLEEIILDNNKLEAYYIALKYISVKLRTEVEISKKLVGFNEDAISYALKRLKKEGYLNKDIYIKAYIHDVINLKKEGPLKIKVELKKRGFVESDVNEHLSIIADDVWINKINKIIDKKISSNHRDSGLFLQKKILTDLKSKGFSMNVVNECIQNFDFHDDEDIFKREYDKVHQKYSKKYIEPELSFKIKQYLYQKGFRQ